MDCRCHIGTMSGPVAALDGLDLHALSSARASDPHVAGILPVFVRQMGLSDAASVALIDSRRRPPQLKFTPSSPGEDKGSVSFGALAMQAGPDVAEALVAGVDSGGAPLLLHLTLAQPGVVVASRGEAHVVVTAADARACRLADAAPVANLAELLCGYEQLGMLLAMLDGCLDYIRGRAAGTWRLDAIPAVRERIADVYLSLLMLRAGLDEALVAFRTGAHDEGVRLLALARLAWFEHAPGCAAACMELHGGIAVVAGHDMQRLHQRLGDLARLTRCAAYWRARLGRAQ